MVASFERRSTFYRHMRRYVKAHRVRPTDCSTEHAMMEKVASVTQAFVIRVWSRVCRVLYAVEACAILSFELVIVTNHRS